MGGWRERQLGMSAGDFGSAKPTTIQMNCSHTVKAATGVQPDSSGKPSPATVNPNEVARHHPRGAAAVFSPACRSCAFSSR